MAQGTVSGVLHLWNIRGRCVQCLRKSGSCLSYCCCRGPSSARSVVHDRAKCNFIFLSFYWCLPMQEGDADLDILVFLFKKRFASTLLYKLRIRFIVSLVIIGFEANW